MDTASTSVRGTRFRIGSCGAVVILVLSHIPTVAAHGGTAHAGRPPWGLVGLILVGLSVIGASVVLDRRQWSDQPSRTSTAVLFGVVLAMLGTIGVIQLQIEPIGTTPTAHEWYPLFAGIAGVSILLTSLVLASWRWPHRPRYPLLGSLLGVWVLYPVGMPNPGYTHPLGYLVLVAVPLVVGYILWLDVAPALTRDVIDPLSRRVGLVVAGLFTVFFLFSAGLFSVNSDQGVNGPTQTFVTTTSFVNPLVVWPAVEFYLPSIPLVGALSVGTALIIGLLTGLIGINTSLITAIWQRDIALSPSTGVVGAFATTGATACCSCGPAIYAIASVVFGVTASPLYWVFIDPASPIGALFFAGAVVFLTGITIRLATRLDTAGICTIPR